MFLSIEKTPYWPQWLAGVIVSLAVLTTGFGNGWTSPYLAKLTSPDSKLALKLTFAEASWVASFLNLGRFIGAVLGAIAQGCIGRKRTLLLSGLPMASGWICIMVATNVTWLYIARLLCGIASGSIWSSLSLFISEIADPKIRGSLIFLTMTTTVIGAFIGNAMGSYLPMEQFSYVVLIATGTFIFLFSFVPETPHHYIIKGDMIRAEESLRWYSGNDDVKREIGELRDFLGLTRISLSKRLRELGNPSNRRNMVTMTCLNVFLYCAGNNTMSYYAEIIVRQSKIDFTPSTVVLVLSFMKILVSIMATVIVDRFARRHLLIGTSIGAAVALASLGYHFHAISGDAFEPSTFRTWLPILALFLYDFSLGCGLVAVPIALIGELFSPVTKTIASMSFSATSALFSFAAAKAFQPFLDLVGEKYVFWTFALSAIASALYTYAFVPETRGKSLAEIQEFMKSDRGLDNERGNGKSVKKDQVDV